MVAPRGSGPPVTAPPARSYRGSMLRVLLMGLAAVVIAVVVISVLVKVAIFGLLFLVVIGVTFLMFRVGRRSRARDRR
jgi:hypothetical protein